MEAWKLIITLILSTIVATSFGVLIIPPECRSLYMVLSIGIPVLIIGTISTDRNNIFLNIVKKVRYIIVIGI